MFIFLSCFLQANHISACPGVRIPKDVNDVQTFHLNDEQLTHKRFIETTSANFTTVEILNYKAVFYLCDLLIIRIVSRDWRRKPKSYGGDQFRLKIYSDKPYSAENADKILDFNNGTYLVYFTLRWSGHVKVQIKLIHPAELLPQLQLTLQGKVGQDFSFLGGFVSNNVSEDVICRYVELPKPHCNLSNPRTHGPWFCQQPKDRGLTCKDWIFHKPLQGNFVKLGEKLTPLSRASIKQSHMVEVKNSHTVFVKNQVTPNMAFADSTLPFCSMRDPIPTSIAAAGHFFNNSWYPNDCKVFKFSPSETMSCLRNKKILIIGDSTIRQIFEFFQHNFKEYFRLLPRPKGVNFNNGPIEMQNDIYNVSIYYRFHGLPRIGLVLKAEFIEYTVDKLDSVESGSKIIVILSLWAHFVVTGRDFYVQRMKAVKSGIQNFLDRCPESKVIIKGANTRENTNVWSPLVSSEWNIMQHELVLRALFQDEKRVGFIDAFDITRAQPYVDHIHPNATIIEEFVNRILTYLCKN
ncbi:NXPE family member 3 [Holothuria leucospilota]|uniref:NXPE family member 3 n=1 Tax=Holothuria leucospilota TaxID=206669 RepID=A0A9Q1BFY2_HOLLE|nr:NXPE family member 3 [Holothuria leucospilota]